MIHTAVTAILAPIILTSICAALRGQDKPSKTTQTSEIKKFIETLKVREKALGAVTMDITTRGSYAGDIVFTTTGSLRVLSTTHFHIRVKSTFHEDELVRSVVETVITPDGVWMHQDGPVESDVYTVMGKDLMIKLKKATRALAADRDTAMRNPGPLADEGTAPLGSATLEALDLQFELAFQEKTQKVDDVECRVIKGNWRGSKAIPDRPGRAVHKVEVFVRKDNGIPIYVVQYNKRERVAGKTKGATEAVVTEKDQIAFEMKITNLDLSPKLDAKSFRLDIPDGVTPMPVLEHRVSRAQINRILQEYAALEKDKKGKPGNTPKK